MEKKFTLPSAVIEARPSQAYGSWENSLIFCCDAPEFGPNCIVQHLCCTPCLLASSLRFAGCSTTETGLVLVAMTCCLESPFPVVASFLARRHVVQTYNIDEGPLTTCLASVFCCPCSQVQVVTKVGAKEDLVYSCARLVPGKEGATPIIMER